MSDSMIERVGKQYAELMHLLAAYFDMTDDEAAEWLAKIALSRAPALR